MISDIKDSEAIKFSFILFAYNLMIECFIKKRENYTRKMLLKKEKETRVKN